MLVTAISVFDDFVKLVPHQLDARLVSLKKFRALLIPKFLFSETVPIILFLIVLDNLLEQLVKDFWELGVPELTVLKSSALKQGFNEFLPAEQVLRPIWVSFDTDIIFLHNGCLEYYLNLLHIQLFIPPEVFQNQVLKGFEVNPIDLLGLAEGHYVAQLDCREVEIPPEEYGDSFDI